MEQHNVNDKMYRKLTTAVEDMDKKAPTNIPSEDLAPHSYTRYIKDSNTQVIRLSQVGTTST